MKQVRIRLRPEVFVLERFHFPAPSTETFFLSCIFIQPFGIFYDLDAGVLMRFLGYRYAIPLLIIIASVHSEINIRG